MSDEFYEEVCKIFDEEPEAAWKSVFAARLRAETKRADDNAVEAATFRLREAVCIEELAQAQAKIERLKKLADSTAKVHGATMAEVFALRGKLAEAREIAERCVTLNGHLEWETLTAQHRHALNLLNQWLDANREGK